MSSKKFFYISISFFLLGWFLLSSQGLRGSDHYWYWAAVRSIVELGEFTSNTVFPASAYTDNYTGSPFIHNIPQVYLAAIPSFIFGYKWGWSIFNLLCTLGGFYFLFKFLLNLGIVRGKALFYISFWILVPINVWMSFQPNSESFVTLLVIMFCYFLLRLQKSNSILQYGYFLLIFVLLIISRINFLLLLFLSPLLFYIWKIKYKKRLFLVCVVFSLFGLFVSSKLFPSAAKGSIVEALNMSQENPYAAPMLGFYNTENPSFFLIDFYNSIPTRLGNTLYVQFFNKHNFIFYSIYNLLTIILIYLIFKYRYTFLKYKFLYALYFSLLLVHLATAFVFQNQFRYLFTILPISIFIFGYVMSKHYGFSKNNKFWRLIRFSNIFMLLFFIVSIVVLNTKVFSESKADNILLTNINNCIIENNIKIEDNVFVSSQNALLSFALFPRKVLSFNPNMLPKSYDQDLMIKNINPIYFFDRNNHAVTNEYFKSNILFDIENLILVCEINEFGKLYRITNSTL